MMEKGKITASQACNRATFVVTLPSLAIIIGGYFLLFAVDQLFVHVALAIIPFLLGWLWWSVAVPRWRVWALERVDDPVELLHTAINLKIIWEPGHIFEKTEIRTAEIRERELAAGWDKLVKEYHEDPYSYEYFDDEEDE